jgi:DNA-directed RNA polymerase subunit M/transcription elongation factor TFIIS
MTGAIIGLFSGFVVGVFANSVLRKKPQIDSEQTTASNVATTTPLATAKKCSNCGISNPAEFKFCGTCGTAFVASDVANQPKKCGKCGATNEAQYKYCGVCGTPLTVPEPLGKKEKDIADQLARFAELRKNGIISEEEFQTAKRKLLS